MQVKTSFLVFIQPPFDIGRLLFSQARLCYFAVFSPDFEEYVVTTFLSSMLFNFVLVWLYKYFDMSVTDESCVDEMRVWRTKL